MDPDNVGKSKFDLFEVSEIAVVGTNVYVIRVFSALDTFGKLQNSVIVFSEASERIIQSSCYKNIHS